MAKIYKKDNILVKCKLIEEIKKTGIKRINIGSIIFLEKYVLYELRGIFKALNEELIVNGKKTLDRNDIKNVLNRIKKKDDFEV